MELKLKKRAIRLPFLLRTLITIWYPFAALAFHSTEIQAQRIAEVFTASPSLVVQLDLEQLLGRYPEILELDRSKHWEKFKNRYVWLSETIKKVTIFHELPDPENWTMPFDIPACEVVYTFEDLDAASAFVSSERITGQTEPRFETQHGFEATAGKNGELWVLSNSMECPWLLHTHSKWPENYQDRIRGANNSVRERFDDLVDSPATLIVVTDAAEAQYYSAGSILGFLSGRLFGSFVLEDTYDDIRGFELLLRVDEPVEFRVTMKMKDEKSAKATVDKFLGKSKADFAGQPSYRRVLERIHAIRGVTVDGSDVKIASGDTELIDAVCDCLVHRLGFKYEDEILPIR